MKELVIASGKGGTGKTSVAASLAALAGSVVLADCDVDAPNLHLVIAPEATESTPFVGGKVARIDEALCTRCGRCLELCRFDAVLPPSHDADAPFRIDPAGCEGCLVCQEFCPASAILADDEATGTVFVSETRFGPMAHAALGPGRENSGKLVTAVRSRARQIADARTLPLVIIDGPPGIGCPVIASLTGATHCLLVTEPTRSALHDMERVAEVARRFQVPLSLCINKHDLAPRIAAEVAARAAALEIEVLGEIRYAQSVTDAQIAERTVIEYTRDGPGRDLLELWTKIEGTLASPREESP